MESRNIYTAAGCNANCGCLDWNSSGVIVYGACNSVVVVDNIKHLSLKTFVKHSANVTSVKWVRKDNDDQQFEIISGGEDCVSILWNMLKPDSCKLLSGHTGSITTVDALFRDGKYQVATGSSDSTLRLWEVANDEVECYQTIVLTPNNCLSVRLAVFAEPLAALLVFSSTDNNIYVYSKQITNHRTFNPLLKLIGHQNWVRDLDFIQLSEDSFLLTSACQDNKIRIWKLFTSVSAATEKYVNALTYDIGENMRTGAQIEVLTNTLGASLETVLHGHDDWVFGIQWHTHANQLNLLSCSADKTIIIWSVSEEGLWYQVTQLGVVGENSSGFYGARLSTDGKLILAYRFDGSIQLWEKINSEWKSRVLLKGHSDSVNSLSWDFGGQRLFTVSADKTTLVHSCLESKNHVTWEVIACPQSHGYEIQCVAAINSKSFATGADEKIVRVFQSSSNGLEKNDRTTISTSRIVEMSNFSPQPLKLSNKAFGSENFYQPLGTSEEHNLKITLWPEIQKLYGHGHEIYAMACSIDGKVLASSCRGFSARDSQIIFWNTNCWKIIRKFNIHKLTVTCIEFSHNCQLLLAVSKDRQFSIYQKSCLSGVVDFELQVVIDTKFIHTRIIWCCTWSHDDLFFATSSRDGKIVFWETAQESAKPNPSKINSFELKGESITSCVFAYDYWVDGNYLIAAGLGTGVIKLYSFGHQIVELLELSQSEAHHLPVLKMGFRPSCKCLQLASCGKDHILRIFEFYCE